jgi:phage shock protein E
MLVACAAGAADKNIRNVAVDEFAKLAESKTNLVLDVRTPKEYSAGHIPGAKLIDFNAPDFEEKVAKLDKSKTYLIHCAAGGRSAKACKKMETLGFTNLVNLAPGFRGWEKAGKPVEK